MNDINELNYDSLKAHDIRYDASDTQPTYIGIHETNNASLDDPNWIIYKFNYDGSAITRIQKAKGSWDGRASLF